MTAPLDQQLDSIAQTYAARPDTAEVRFAMSSPSRGWSWSWDSPAQHEPYFIASTTKLYVTAVLLRLRADGRIDLDAPAAQYLPPGTMDGLHTLGGVDFSGRITVRELMAHTSGIADYFEARRADGGTTIGRAFESDRGWTFDEILEVTRAMRPHFPPSTPGKALYSDTNYQLLGRIIEHVTGDTWEQAVTGLVLEPLGLADTWPFDASTLARYDEVAPMLLGAAPVRIPLAMGSVNADGGIVSTTADQLRFLQAFMGGELFPAADLAEIQREWRRIFPPLQYGTGIMLFELPWYFTMGQKVPRLVGHSGASGAVLYYAPDIDLYVAGTVNQIKKRSLSYNAMVRLVMTADKAWRTR